MPAAPCLQSFMVWLASPWLVCGTHSYAYTNALSHHPPHFRPDILLDIFRCLQVQQAVWAVDAGKVTQVKFVGRNLTVGQKFWWTTSATDCEDRRDTDEIVSVSNEGQIADVQLQLDHVDAAPLYVGASHLTPCM